MCNLYMKEKDRHIVVLLGEKRKHISEQDYGQVKLKAAVPAKSKLSSDGPVQYLGDYLSNS